MTMTSNNKQQKLLRLKSKSKHSTLEMSRLAWSRYNEIEVFLRLLYHSPHQESDIASLTRYKECGDVPMLYHVLLIDSEDGGYTVEVPALPGCISEGDTREEALRNVREAIEGYLAVLQEDGRQISSDARILEVDTVEVNVAMKEAVA